MNSFTIIPNINWFTNPITNNRQRGQFISKSIDAFCHSYYQGGNSERRETIGTVENIITTLKNQFQDKSKDVLIQAGKNLIEILKKDLPQILQKTEKNNLTVCIIPRAKALTNYTQNQLVFKQAVTIVAKDLKDFSDGTDYIIRHTNTRTTHLDRSGYGGDGDLPYPSITKKTCSISDDVKGKDILLIDDLYTETVNIDEDAIQALLDNGANSVVFYSVGKTLHDSHLDAPIVKSESVKNTDEIYLLPEIYKETYSLLKKGNTIEQIVKKKELTTETIIKHITEISKILGNKNIESIKPPIETIIKVRFAVSKIGSSDKLRPVFEELNERVSYNEIRLSLLFIR